MTAVDTCDVLNRLLILHSRSLPMYLSYAAPWQLKADAPGVAVIYAMGAIFNPFGVALAAGTGGAVGELSGYLAGFGGQAVIERMEVYDRVRPWVEKYGGWAILVLSAIPNPFFDIAGIAAGIAKMPVRTFLVFTWVGQLIKMLLFALAGKYSIQWLATFFE